MSVAYSEWAVPRLVAELWWCGDDRCDCTQPQIVRLTPNTVMGYPWVHREAVWEGEFLTDTWELSEAEREALHYAPLRGACERLGVQVPEVARAA
jgi:hypothetical protein